MKRFKQLNILTLCANNPMLLDIDDPSKIIGIGNSPNCNQIF